MLSNGASSYLRNLFEFGVQVGTMYRNFKRNGDGIVTNSAMIDVAHGVAGISETVGSSGIGDGRYGEGGGRSRHDGV